MKLISWKIKLVFSKIIVLFICENINTFDHIEFYSVINLTMASNWATSVCNQPIPFPVDRDGHDFLALFQSIHVFYVGTKLHAYRVIL